MVETRPRFGSASDVHILQEAPRGQAPESSDAPENIYLGYTFEQQQGVFGADLPYVKDRIKGFLVEMTVQMQMRRPKLSMTMRMMWLTRPETRRK